MANFTTHIAVGTLASGAFATLVLAADMVAPENLAAVAVAGVLGSVMPDIDLEDSRPSRALFAGLAAFFSFATLFLLVEHLSIAELWLMALAVFLLVRYGAHAVFHRMSYHRGIYHSLIAAVFFALATAVIYRSVLGRHEGVAWLAAAFMLMGYLVHLTLDEIYSVDVMDTRIKSSFGTALKPFDAKHPGHSLAMAAAAAAMFFLAPSSKTFVEGVSQRAVWVELQHRLLPRETWFKGLAEFARNAEHAPRLYRTGEGPSATSGVTTGTLAPASDKAPASK